MQKNETLGTQSIGKLFIKLSIPAVLAQVINLLYNVVDRIYIGHIGTNQLVGVGVCLPLIMFISAFASLCGMGGAPRASIKLGENKIEEANKILGNCFSLTLIMSVILTIVFAFTSEILLSNFGADELTLPYALNYFNTYLYGTIFVMIALGLNAFITTQGFSTISMGSVIIGAVLNIILDPLFIFTFNLNVQGAAIATIISQAVSAIFIIIFLLSKKTILKISLKQMHLKANIILPCIALGLSPFIMQSTESILSICFNTSLKKYGSTIAVSSMTILTSCMQFAMLPLQGFTQGAQPIISYNYGALNKQRVQKAFKVLLITCVVYSMIFYILVMLFPKLIAQIFTNDQDLIAYTEKTLRIYMGVIGVFGIQIACQQTFIALGNAPISLFLALLRKVILLIPLIYIVPIFTSNKVYGVLLAEPIADIIAVTTTAICFYFIFKKTLKLMDQKVKDLKSVS